MKDPLPKGPQLLPFRELSEEQMKRLVESYKWKYGYPKTDSKAIITLGWKSEDQEIKILGPSPENQENVTFSNTDGILAGTPLVLNATSKKLRGEIIPDEEYHKLLEEIGTVRKHKSLD